MSLKRRLAKRARPSLVFRLRITDDAAAQSALREAVMARRTVEIRDGSTAEEKASADKAVDDAQAEVDKHYEKIKLVALPPKEMEALIALHPPKADKKDTELWDEETFRVPLIAAVAQGDMTEADWAEQYESGSVTMGDLNALFQACCAVNDRSPGIAVGKD